MAPEARATCLRSHPPSRHHRDDLPATPATVSPGTHPPMPSASRPHAPHIPAAERREQFVRSAMRAFAERGYSGVQLADLATDVGVSKNLIHHYFPGGKDELYLSAVRLGCADLEGLLDVSDTLPLERRTSANLGVYLDEIFAPSPAWILYVRAQHSADPQVRAAAERLRETLARGVARNQLGTDEPDAHTLVTLIGLLSFAEATADRWRDLRPPDRDRLERLMLDVLDAALESLET